MPNCSPGARRNNQTNRSSCLSIVPYVHHAAYVLTRAALGSTSARGSRRAGISLPSPGPLRARGSVDAIRSSQAVHPRRAGRTPADSIINKSWKRNPRNLT
eukprot:3149356-Rhodomonas_salina.1